MQLRLYIQIMVLTCVAWTYIIARLLVGPLQEQTTRVEHDFGVLRALTKLRADLGSLRLQQGLVKRLCERRCWTGAQVSLPGSAAFLPTMPYLRCERSHKKSRLCLRWPPWMSS
ncbi:g8608 [Coccomyxa viridis]|uniref:G8608 protein n=1 Tax=Coccomyxa viridis TaxID=1274662 RepID=A0ABP1G3F6_9CHLO